MEMTAEEIRHGAYTGDKEKDIQMINAFLSGSVSVKQEGSVEEPVTPNNTVTETSEESESVIEPDFDAEEEERKRKYEQFLKEKELTAQIEEERKKQILIAKQKEEELEKERKARSEAEARLKELSELQQKQTQQRSTTNSNSEDEEEFMSDALRSTRDKVDRLESLVNELGSNHPKVKELEDELKHFRGEYNTIIEEKQRKDREEEEKRQRDKLYGGIREFQNRYQELKTSKDIEEVDREYQQFRNDMAAAIKAKSFYELEQAISDYFAGGDYKKLADEKGIKAPVEYDKYQAIVELNETKRGIKYDPVTGKDIPILNDEGRQVTYRSLDEAYYVKNREKELSDARKRSSLEMTKKLSQLNSGAVELPTDNVGAAVQQGYTKDQVREILNLDPRSFINDPNKLEEVKRIYTSMGYDSLVYRGRKVW